MEAETRNEVNVSYEVNGLLQSWCVSFLGLAFSLSNLGPIINFTNFLG
jgi:hypothetical protein